MTETDKTLSLERKMTLLCICISVSFDFVQVGWKKNAKGGETNHKPNGEAGKAEKRDCKAANGALMAAQSSGNAWMQSRRNRKRNKV